MVDRSPYGIRDCIVGLVKHLGLDEAGDLARSLGFGKYFREPPEKEDDPKRIDRYARDLYGHLLGTDVATFFQRHLPNLEQAQDYALSMLEDDDELLSRVSEASSVLDVLALLGLRVQSDRELTYGIEDCIRRIRDRVNDLAYTETYGEDILSDLLRGRAIGLWSEVEMLLKVLVVFYKEYFAERDRITGDAFERAFGAKSLGRFLVSIQEIERCFLEGETSWQHNARRQKLRERREEIESSLQRMEREHNRRRREISKIIRQKDTEIDEVNSMIGEVAFQLSDTRGEKIRQNLGAELNRLRAKREALEHQRTQYRKEEDRLNEEEERERSRVADEIARLRDQFDEYTQQRRQIAAKLQLRCQRLLERTSPFEGMDLDRIHRLVGPYRNQPAHWVQELLKEDGAIQRAQAAGDEILTILFEWLARGLFPRTAQVLGQWRDVYGRTLWALAVDDPNDNPEPLWSIERLIWMYEWKTRPWGDNEVCLVAAAPGQMVFEPIIFSWSDIKPTLMSLFTQDDPHEEEL